MKKNDSFLSSEEKRKAINDIINFFKDERDEEIGFIAAGNLLDFFLEEFGSKIYNKGIENSRNFMRKKFEDLELDLEVLLKK